MVLPIRPPYSDPIPNNPFYSPEQYAVQGIPGLYIVGSGLSVSSSGVLSSTGGGGAVTGVFAGTGISVSSNTGSVTVTNTGVTGLVAGTGISLSGSTGNISISSTANGTVTAINTGTGLTGGPIFTSGTISLSTTGVVAATYSNASITVNAEGRITSAASNTVVGSVAGTSPINVSLVGSNATVSINAASTTQSGAVQLSDSVSSTSSTEAATSLAVKTAYDAAVAAIPKSCITGVGTLVTGVGASTPVALAVGSNGYVLTADSTCIEGIKWAAVPATPDATPLAAGKIVGCTVSITFGLQGQTALGIEALSCSAAGATNPSTAIGWQAMKLASGPHNVAIGQCALYGPQVFGADNIAIGNEALKGGGGADGNVAIGSNAGQSITSGACNVLIGCAAAAALASGGNNVLIGTEVAAGKTNGFGGTFIGYRAGCSVGSTQDSTFVGQYAGCGASGLRNTLFGARAGCALTTGNDNVILGYGANVANPAGDTQLAIGMGPSNWLSGTSTFAIKPGAGIIDCAGSCGTNGQVLMSNGANAICWGSASVAQATPTVLGTVYGCTCSSSFFNTSYGYGSNAGSAGSFNTGIGCGALAAMASGGTNTAVGHQAGTAVNSGQCNTMVGGFAGKAVTSGIAVTAIGRSTLCLATGNCNVGLGAQAGNLVTIGANNTLLGTYAGCNLTTGNNNVAIGINTTLASAAGSCQLAIGFSATDNWLTGNSTKAIQPGAGIIDCAASCGTANMVLTSQGNAIQWKSVSSAIAAPNYGSFLSTVTQTATGGANVGIPVLLNTTVAANNFSVVSNSRVTAAVGGTYNLQFSIQIQSTAAGGNVEIWLAKNGTAIANSNTRFYLGNSNEAEFAALNFVETLAAGDYLELIWGTDNSNIQLLASSSILTTPGPNIPSVILTIVPVGA